MSQKFSFMDKAFYITESDASPKHVAALQIFSKPEGAGENYVSEFVDEMRSFDNGCSPFNVEIKSVLGYPVGSRQIEKMDMDYHVQYHKIGNVENRQELHDFIAELHGERMDNKKPLWIKHVIEGKEGNQFAMHLMIHHMYGDGAYLMRRFQEAYSTEPQERFIPIWSSEHTKKKRHREKKKTNPFNGLWHALVSIVDLLFIFFRILMKLVRIYPQYMPVPFSGKKTVLTGQVKKGRVISTVDIDYVRLKSLSKRLRASINELLLCSIDIAVHRFLRDHGHTFDKSIITQMPINLRREGDDRSGNMIAIVPAELAHGKKDPYLRLREIIENLRIVKGIAKRVEPAAFIVYTLLIQSTALLFELFRVSDWFKPIGNILISNMPGPKEHMYIRDCRLEAIYPISALTPGGGVNFTLITYADHANIGMISASQKIKSLEPLAEYFKDAFDLLEKCIDDPELTIDDLAEHVIPYKAVIDEEEPHIEKDNAA